VIQIHRGSRWVHNSVDPATPSMYLYHAVRDQYPAIADVDKLVDKYRSEGVEVIYKRYRFGKHAVVALTGVPSALRFLTARLQVSD
jgi:Secretory lipase